MVDGGGRQGEAEGGSRHEDTTDRAKQPNAARTAHNGTGCMLSGALELLPSHPAAPHPPLVRQSWIGCAHTHAQSARYAGCSV